MVRVAGQEDAIAVGERGRWLRVPFTIPSWPPRTVHGRVRFFVREANPLTVLSSPVQIDPLDPALPISSPEDYAAYLERQYGAFKTAGWMEETFQLNDRNLSEEAFLKDLLEDMDLGTGILLGELRRGGRCVFYVFTQTDRAAHCFFRLRDKGLLGGMGRAVDVCVNNLYPWSGDHCSTDRDLVPGILLSNRPIPPAPVDRPYGVRDVAATVLRHFDLDVSDLDASPIPVGR